MKQHLGLTALVVRDYDEAIGFFVGTLGFTLVEDTCQPAQDKRWVVVAPHGAVESGLLLARVTNDVQRAAVGNQSGGRVFLFLYTDDFWRDYERYRAKGVEFVQIARGARRAGAPRGGTPPSTERHRAPATTRTSRRAGSRRP